MAVAAVAVTKAGFGKLPDGRAVELYTAKNADLEVTFTTYGARIVSLKAKDRDGKVGDVVLGYNSVDGYVAEGAAKTYVGHRVRILGRFQRVRLDLDGRKAVQLMGDGPTLVDAIMRPSDFDDAAANGYAMPLVLDCVVRGPLEDYVRVDDCTVAPVRPPGT